ncbi:MAG: hypothetical protein IT303_19685 [Dehalococcoidia bacterium]|nr:hypothetical protein [Dehalococcoidia bacterium]
MLIATRTRGSQLVFGERGLVFDIGLALLTGLGVAVAKRYLDFHLGIPGHAGTFWIAVLVLGAVFNKRKGMTVLAGASAGVWGVPVGLNHSMMYNVELYGTAAAALELLLLLRLPLANPIGAALGGGIAHATKFAFVYAHAISSGVVKHIEVYGPMLAFRNHLLFGVAGGLIAWAVYNAAKSARKGT